MNVVNQFSKGCQLCQQGKWLCIYLTYKCNAHCHFCAAPFKNDRVQSAFGSKKEEILSYLIQNDFGGISFSGGDPFVVFDRLLEWQIYFKKNLPDYYFWVYTNGLDVDERKLEQLSMAGMNEIRFNIAATGYQSEAIWKQIKTAKDLFPFVTVEIPSISQDFRLLESSIENLHKYGVNYLNLHDYIQSESDDKFIREPSENFVLNKTIHLKYALSSIKNTQDILKLASDRGFNFIVNHCSMQKKELQMVQRRLKMGKIFNDPEYDMVLDDGTICNIYYISGSFYNQDLKFKMIDSKYLEILNKYRVKVDQMNINLPSGFVKLEASYIPKMEINQTRTLIDVNLIL